MEKVELMKRVMASLASIGDIYSDAPECKASVAAAKNLSVLARYLASDTEIIMQGDLYGNGVFVCNASVRIDGSLLVDIPEEFDTSGVDWVLRFPKELELPVSMFVGECGDDEAWVVDNAENFYAIVLGQAWV